MFDWDENNLRKIRAHRIQPEEIEHGLSNGPILIYEQDVEGELRYVYYCETAAGRLLATILIERGDRIRVVTAYDLDAGQKRTIRPGGCKGSESMKRDRGTCRDSLTRRNRQTGGPVARAANS